MEDLINLYSKLDTIDNRLEDTYQGLMAQMRDMLNGQTAPAAVSALPAITNVLTEEQNNASPQQTKKRIKCLSMLQESDCEVTEGPILRMDLGTPVRNTRSSNSKLLEVADELNDQHMESPKPQAPLPAPRTGKAKELLIENDDQSSNNTESSLMPPPPPPSLSTVTTAVVAEQSFSRPQRAAKLKSEKNLKEPKINTKLRRPSNNDEIKVKLEHEQRASQAFNATKVVETPISQQNDTVSIDSIRSEDFVVPAKTPSVVVPSDDEGSNIDKAKEKETGRQLRVKIKREKPSLPIEEQQHCSNQQQQNPVEPTEVVQENPSPDQSDATFKVPSTIETIQNLPIGTNIKTEKNIDESTMSSTVLSATTVNTTVPVKKGRKKKEAHRPIKVERFSDIDKASPISSRTRQGTTDNVPDANSENVLPQRRSGTMYEDAIDSLPLQAETATPPSRLSQVPNEVMTAAEKAGMMTTTTAADATYLANATFKMPTDNQNPNATITLNKNTGGVADATFDVPVNDKERSLSNSTKNSMETARENDSIITEDESFERRVPPAPPAQKLNKPKAPGATTKSSYKMPLRNELFNPLVQSPVKMRVEAFENVASAAVENNKNIRPKRTKENMTPSQLKTGTFTTPVVGKLKAPTLGRFLTPTQTPNIQGSATIAAAKKGPNSASKATAFPKTNSVSKPLSRENSVDDFRKGLLQNSEERKKQREQKHLLAAQQREAKERERAERMQKIAKEREEKRLKKQMEAEQKKRELEEIQKKLRQQEEAAAAAEAAKQKAAKEREILAQLKLQQQNTAKPKFLMPPPPKSDLKYTFEMLHEDDSTDDEGKVSDTRPPPPQWSLSSVRWVAIQRQQYCPTAIIDSFFSVQPTTPDLQLIFPNIDARYLKRNSSVLWSTPPRYSELPKY